MSDPITVELDTPLMLGSEQIKTLSFREPRAGDMRGIKITINGDGLSLDLGAILDIAAKLSGVAPSVMDQASFADCSKIVMAVAPLLPASLLDGS